MNAVIKIIDTFAGAGGMTLGFVRSSVGQFEPVWANDFNGYAVNTYNANFGNHCIGRDVINLLNDPDIFIHQADVVIR